MQLPLFKTDITDLSLLQNKWKSLLDPVLANPLNGILILDSVLLSVGSNKIAHLLGQVQQGWLILDINGIATIYRSQPLNKDYLYLTSSAAVTVSLGVF